MRWYVRFIQDIFTKRAAKKSGFLLIEFLLSLMIGSMIVLALATTLVLVYGRAIALNKQWQNDTKYIYACTRLNALLAAIAVDCVWEKWSSRELVWQKRNTRYRLTIKNNRLLYRYANTSVLLLECEGLDEHSRFSIVFAGKKLKALTYSLCCPLSQYCYEGYIIAVK